MSTLASNELLKLCDLKAGYGNITVIDGINLKISAGEFVALLGPNGAGKTTLLRAISGLIPCTGTIDFGGQRLKNGVPFDAVKNGISHVIEGHRIFTQISIQDNLMLAGYSLPRNERLRRVEEALLYFPELAEKRHALGGALSGGQQQMLAVAQGLVQRPKLLMLDEPSAGLSPILVDRVLSVARRLCDLGMAILLVEQLITKTLAVADRVVAFSQGQIAFEGKASDPEIPSRLEAVYFGHDMSAS